MKREVVEDVCVFGGLVSVQFVYAGQSVLLSYLMSIGINPLSIIIFFSFSSFLILSPLAVHFERSKWPKKMSLKLLIQLVLISFGGVTLFQTLYLKGMKLTSPTMATAMPNLAPGLIFVIAWTFRIEKVKISCMYSKVKIVGTLVCVLGALTMSIMHSTSKTVPTETHLSSLPPDFIFDKQKIVGCLFLLVAVVILSTNVVLQAKTLGDFPAPISLCAITSMIGAFLTTALQLFQDRKVETVWSHFSVGYMIGFSLLGGIVNGVSVSFNGWAMKKRGPVMVSMFSPISTLCSLIFSAITLGETVNLGSLVGMSLVFFGLYFVLWAKGKEGFFNGDGFESEFDEEKPLLS